MLVSRWRCSACNAWNYNDLREEHFWRIVNLGDCALQGECSHPDPMPILLKTDGDATRCKADGERRQNQ